MSNNHICLTTIQGCLVYALDIGYLFEDAYSSDLISERVSEEWLTSLRNKLQNWEIYGYSFPHFVESEYGKTDRSRRNTFAKKLLPLELKISNSKKHIASIFTYNADSIRISPQGGISIRVIYESKGINLSAKDTINEFSQLLEKIPALLQESLADFVVFWNSSVPQINLITPNIEFLKEILYSYEIFDFDFHITDGEKTCEINSIKSLYTDKNIIPVCELYSIAKMSPASATSLNDTRLFEFIATDIGGRNDELWSINRERMLRYHPDRDSLYNKALFSDIKTAVEILISQKATFDFLEEWVDKKRKIVLEKMLYFNCMDEKGKNDFHRQFGEVMGTTQLLIEPVLLQKNVRHAFYLQAVSSLVSSLGIQDSNQKASYALKDFAQLIESVSGYRNSDLVATMGSIQIQLAKSAKRIGFITIFIALVSIILTIIQVYLALISDG